MSKIDISKGRYWDKPWSLVDGCTPCSPGCDHCWSAAMACRFKKGLKFNKDTRNWFEGGEFTEEKGHFNGTVLSHYSRLDIPLRTRKPTVFAIWNDLFHEGVDTEFIRSAFSVMAQARNHTFLVLTKRPYKLRDGFAEWERIGLTLREGYRAVLPNVWTGLTVCNQQEADEKIPIFLQVPGKKFMSIEPMLGPINFRWAPYHHQATGECYREYLERKGSIDHLESLKGIDAVILGGESGQGSRPMLPDWVRGLRDQCEAAEVPFFFKQWGGWAPPSQISDDVIMPMRDAGVGFDPDSEIPRRFGRKATDRLLDGRTHDELPWVKETDG